MGNTVNEIDYDILIESYILSRDHVINGPLMMLTIFFGVAANP